MPNRIVREGIITSEPVNQLGWPEEVFYRRLLSVVDDYGRFSGNPTLLRAACYPLQIDKVGNRDIGKWLTECVRAGLVKAYTVHRKEYIEVVKFGQQVRAKSSKYPDPPGICVADDTHVISTGEQLVADAHLDVDVFGVANGRSRFLDFWHGYPRKVGKGAAEKAWDKIHPDDSLAEKILAAVSAQQWSPDTRFIPHPSTWLNEKRWEDEPFEARKHMVM